MTYIENIFICLAIPMFLSLFFTKESTRVYTIFVIAGMAMCLLSAYVNSFFMGIYKADAMIAAIEITPFCEEVMKLLPLLFFILIFEPDKKELPGAAIVIAIGFATFENVCYLTENGAENFSFLLIRGCSAGALHFLCGIFMGYSASCEFNNFWLTMTGTIGALGACIGFHAIYNLLITATGIWRSAGYIFPSVLIIILFVAKHLHPKQMIPAE